MINARLFHIELNPCGVNYLDMLSLNKFTYVYIYSACEVSPLYICGGSHREDELRWRTGDDM